MKLSQKFCLLSILLFSGYNLFAQSKITGHLTNSISITQYVMAEWDIDVIATFENPYLQEEIVVNMLLTSPSGKTLVLPCYYESISKNNKSLWKARFLPQENGRYSYRFELKKDGKIYGSAANLFSAKPSDKKGIMHKNDLWTFKFDNGLLYRGLGENICWESRDNDDSKFFKELHEDKKYNYEQMLPKLANNGGDYYRTWICSWNLPLDWKGDFNNSRYKNSDEYFNPSAVQKLDRLVNLSDSLGLYTMLTLGAGSLDGGNGRFPVSAADFFINPKAKAQYKNRLRFIVARWGYSPSIGAWEFFNEIDNIQFRNKDNPIEAAHIVQWHAEMSAYLSELDPYKHLITTSISHRDLEGLNSLKHIDFNQKHIYKNNRALPTTIVKYSEDFKKPYVIGEYGYEYDWQKNFNDFAAEMDSDFKRGLWYGLFSPTPVLPLSWWWEYFDNRGTDKYLSNVRKVLDEMMLSGHGSFKSIKVSTQTPEVEVYAVKCGAKTFVYVYNASNVNTKPIIVIDGPDTDFSRGTKMYSCELGAWFDLKSTGSNRKNTLDGFQLEAKNDVIFVF